MHYHPPLRKSKRHKDTNSIQVYQLCCIAPKHNEEETSEYGQKDDTDRKVQTITAKGKLMWHKVVKGQERGKPRKSRIAGISSQCENQQGRNLKDRIHENERASEHPRGKLSNDWVA